VTSYLITIKRMSNSNIQTFTVINSNSFTFDLSSGMV
jgi:hypothetical protein